METLSLVYQSVTDTDTAASLIRQNAPIYALVDGAYIHPRDALDPLDAMGDAYYVAHKCLSGGTELFREHICVIDDTKLLEERAASSRQSTPALLQPRRSWVTNALISFVAGMSIAAFFAGAEE